MPRTGERGGPATRARIREVSNRMFIERGYDAVTVADVAREAGVSSVTVFNHFPRKEDLFLDRTDEVVDLLRSAVQQRKPGVDVLTALQNESVRLFDERHAFSGVDPLSAGFFRTVAHSPALSARAREILAELQAVLAAELEQDAGFAGDAPLFAALFLSGYSSVLVGTARRVIEGQAVADVAPDHRIRLDRLFEALRNGLAV
jgi:AcrR family transcriptional regulator